MTNYRELIGFVWRYMKPQKRTFSTIFLLDSLAWPLDALLWPYLLSLVIDVFTRYEGDRLSAWGALKVPMFGAIALVASVEIGSRTMGFLMAKGIPKLEADIRMGMFEHIQRHSPRYFNDRFAGSLANKITDMTTQVVAILQELVWPILPALVTILFGAIILFFINPVFASILLGWIGVHLGICLFFTRSCDQLEHVHGEARTTLLGKIVDSFTNNFAINLFFRFSHERKLIAPFQLKEQKTNVEARRYVEKMRCCLSLSFILGPTLGINGFLLHYWIAGNISTGQMVQVFNTVWNLTVVMWTVGCSFPLLFQSFGTLRQAYSVMTDPEDLGDKERAENLAVKRGEITFKNVSFHFGDHKLFENKQVEIRGGEKVGLVGYSGAGKSTFINLILRFFPLEKGEISIDGHNIAEMTLESLRRQIALIPQDPVLFHRTIRENISFGKPGASEGEILEAAHLAHCDEFIKKIPNGYDATVGERGTKLSGGEKQRVAIARAILADAPILILDEATSALDSITERFIQDSLDTLMQGRTTLVIAHRLSTLSRMDRILVFDQGKIVEEGTHTLLLRKEGHYANMWKMQVGGFLPLGRPSDSIV